MAHEGGELSLTRLTVGMLVQQMTMPWKGLDGSKNSVKSASEEAGGDSMASGLSIVYTAECVGFFTSSARLAESAGPPQRTASRGDT